MEEEFAKELEALINKHSEENKSDTPDFIISGFLRGCLEAFHNAIRLRDNWYRDPEKIECPTEIKKGE